MYSKRKSKRHLFEKIKKQTGEKRSTIYEKKRRKCSPFTYMSHYIKFENDKL